jgi:hypothetical protein
MNQLELSTGGGNDFELDLLWQAIFQIQMGDVAGPPGRRYSTRRVRLTASLKRRAMGGNLSSL